jgi:hypothetical protein
VHERAEDNCQILQTRANRWKSAKMGVTKEQLRDVSCDLQLSGTHHTAFVFFGALSGL